MLSATDIADLVALMRSHGVSEIELANGGSSLRLVAAPGQTPPIEPPSPPSSLVISSPGVGRLTTDRAPGLAFAEIDSAVGEGQVLGLLATGFVRRAVVAPTAGVLCSILVPPGTLVGFGTPVFEISTSGGTQAGAGKEDS